MQLKLTKARHIADFPSVWCIHFDRTTDLEWLGELIQEATGLQALDSSSDGKHLTLGATGTQWGDNRDEVCRTIAEFLGLRSVRLVLSN